MGERENNFDKMLNILGSITEKAILFFDNGDLYRVIYSSETEKGLREGKLTIREIGKYIESAARKVDGKKPFAEHALLEKARYPNLFQTIYIMGIEQQLNNQLITINKKLDNIYEGLHRDRIAEIKAGLEKYFTSFYVQNANYKRERLKEAISHLENGRSKLIANIKVDIQQLEYELRKLQNPLQKYVFINTDEIIKKVIMVHEALNEIITASMYIYLANNELGELSAAEASLESVRKLLKEVSKSGYKISRLLPYDEKAPPEGIWESGIEKLDKLSEIKNGRYLCVIDTKNRKIEILPVGKSKRQNHEKS